MKVEEMYKKYCSQLKEKVRLLDCFGQATAKVKDAIQAKDIPRMALHVKERQRIIGRIERIDREVRQFVQGYGFSIEELSNNAKDLVRTRLDQIRLTLESLADVDKECLAMAQAEHESLKSDILNVRRGLNVARGYRGTYKRSPRFLDVRR